MSYTRLNPSIDGLQQTVDALDSIVFDTGSAAILQHVNTSTNTTYRINITDYGQLMLGKKVGSGSWTTKVVDSI